MKKLIDSNLIRRSGWSPSVDIESGLKLAYKYFLESEKND